MWLIKTFISLILSVPLLLFVSLAQVGELGPDPGKELIIYFGHTALIILLITLALPILKKIKGLHFISRCSRLIGLWSFTYASLHLLSYLAFVTGFSVAILTEDLTGRPYAYIGMFAWLILLLLAVTSNAYSQRKLKRNWKLLHRFVNLALLAILVHVLWVARSDLVWFLLYSFVFVLLIWLKYPIIMFFKNGIRFTR